MSEKQETKRRVKSAFKALLFQMDTASGVTITRTGNTVEHRYLPPKGELRRAYKMVKEAMKIAMSHLDEKP